MVIARSETRIRKSQGLRHASSISISSHMGRPDDIGIGATDRLNHKRTDPLNGISPCLVKGFARFHVPFHFGRGKAFHPHRRFNHPSFFFFPFPDGRQKFRSTPDAPGRSGGSASRSPRPHPSVYPELTLQYRQSCLRRSPTDQDIARQHPGPWPQPAGSHARGAGSFPITSSETAPGTISKAKPNCFSNSHRRGDFEARISEFLIYKN